MQKCRRKLHWSILWSVINQAVKHFKGMEVAFRLYNPRSHLMTAAVSQWIFHSNMPPTLFQLLCIHPRPLAVKNESITLDHWVYCSPSHTKNVWEQFHASIREPALCCCSKIMPVMQSPLASTTLGVRTAKTSGNRGQPPFYEPQIKNQYTWVNSATSGLPFWMSERACVWIALWASVCNSVA